MEIDIDKVMLDAIKDGLRNGVAEKFSSYNSPLQKLFEDVCSAKSGELRELLESSLSECLNDQPFRDEIKAALRTSLAKSLIHRFGGEMEKQVNALKSDPTTRARITLAIEDIVKSKT